MIKFLLLHFIAIGCGTVDSSKSNLESGFWNETVWSCCAIENNGVSSNFNVCSKIHFNNGGIGKYIDGSNFEYTFKWTVNDSILFVKEIDSLNYVLLEKGRYKFYPNEDSSIIKLEKFEDELTLYLGK